MVTTTNQYTQNSSDYPDTLIECLSWSEKGYSVLPLKGKNPCGKWGTLRSKPATRKEIVEWFTQDPQANYGIILGKHDVVIDVDHLDKLPNDLHLSPSYLVRTGRGFHIYYRNSGKPFKTKHYSWGECRSDGSYIVGPYSTHPNTGETYLPLDDSLEIVELPEHLRDYFSRDTERDKGECHQNSICSTSDTPRSTSYPRNEEKGIDVRRYFTDPQIALSAMNLIGYEDVKIGKPIRCPFRDDDQRPSAALYRQTEGCQYLIHDFHCLGDKTEWRTIPDAYFAKKSGQVDVLSHAGYVIWGIRLLNEIGAITLPEIDTPDLPDKAPATVKRLWEGFILLLRCREFYLAGQSGTPLSYGFAVAWCGLPDKIYAARGFKWLREHGLLTALPKTKGKSTMYVIPTEEANVEIRPTCVVR